MPRMRFIWSADFAAHATRRPLRHRVQCMGRDRRCCRSVVEDEAGVRAKKQGIRGIPATQAAQICR